MPRAAHWAGELTGDPQVEPISLALRPGSVQPRRGQPTGEQVKLDGGV